MDWTPFYIPPQHSDWQGRADTPPHSSFFQLIKLLNLKNKIRQAKNLSFGLIGFSCDEGIRRNFGRVGAIYGPHAIRHMLATLPVQRPDIVCYDAGDITCTNSNLEDAQAALGEAVALLLKHEITPIVLGGGHELAWAHYQGIAKELNQKTLGIVNFDAHFDMRPLLPNQEGSSGTPFLQIANAHEAQKRRFDYNCIGIQRTGNVPALFETAQKHHTHVLFAEDLEIQNHFSHTFTDRIITENDAIYVSLCLDVIAAPYAPGVSAPQPFGIRPWKIIPILRQLATSGKVISYDIAELSPPHDIDHRTAKLAAQFIYEIIHHHIAMKGI